MFTIFCTYVDKMGDFCIDIEILRKLRIIFVCTWFLQYNKVQKQNKIWWEKIIFDIFIICKYICKYSIFVEFKPNIFFGNLFVLYLVFVCYSTNTFYLLRALHLDGEKPKINFKLMSSQKYSKTVFFISPMEFL